MKADVPADQTKTSAVTPLTTVIASVESAEDKQKVLTALGLGDKTPEEIATTDPWAGSEAGDESAQAIQRVNTQVATVLKTAAKVSEGGTSDATAVSNSVAQSIASAATAAADTGASVDLSEPDTIGDVLEDAAEDAGVEVDEAVVDAVANAVSVVNTAAADTTVNPTSSVAIEIAQAAEETIEEDVADVVSGEASVEEFEESTSAEAILGDVDTGDAPDLDGDGLADAVDDDDDGDGVSDSVDAFPRDSTESVDTDSDGIGNNADDDDDADGVADATDAFPLDASETIDTDGDGVGNNADSDDDADGYADASDAFPLDDSEWVDTDGDGTGNNADTDDDGDLVPDVADIDPLDATVGGNGFNVVRIALIDYTDGRAQGTSISAIPSVSSGVVTIAPANSLDLSNLNAASTGAESGKTPAISMILDKVPAGGDNGSLTVTATVVDGVDASRDEGERSVSSSLSIDWASDGDAVTVTVPSQTATITAVLSDGTAIEAEVTNGDSDSATFTASTSDAPASLDLKIAAFLASTAADTLSLDNGLFEAGEYHLTVDIDQTGLDNLFYQGSAFSQIKGAFTIAEKEDVAPADAFNGTSVSITDPSSGQSLDYGLNAMLAGTAVDFAMYGNSLSADTLNSLANGELAVALSPTLNIALDQVPDAGSSGEFTISVTMTEGSDSTRDSGERSVSSALVIDWSSDGTSVTATAGAQTATITAVLGDGTALESTATNTYSDSISFSYGGPEIPATLNANIAHFIARNPGEASYLEDIFRAGTIYVNVEVTGLDNLYFQSENVTSVQGTLIIE